MDPYDVLGVSRDASDDEIKEAYREKVKEFHPDTSDREDAAEMFKKVKDAYEVVYSGDSEGVSSAYPGGDGDKTGTEKTGGDDRESEEARGDSDGFGATGGWTRSGGVSGGTKEGTRTSTQGGQGEGFYDNWDRRNEGWKEAERKEKRRNSYEEEEETEYGEDPENFEVREEYGMGWKLGHAETGEWFVFTEGETAPYVDGTKMLYLDLDGNISTEPVYFGSKEAAEENYEEHYGAEDGFGYEHDKKESHRGFSHKGESYRRRTEERTDGFEEEGWGEKQEAGGFDGLWRLYYQEKRGKGDQNRRWGVTTKVTGDDRFVNPEGEYQRSEFWFDERRKAMKAYKKYVERMKETREGFESGADEADGWSPPTGDEDDTLLFRTADRSITFLEALEDTVKPLKEHSLTTVVAVCLLVGVVAYVVEPVREILAVLSTPVYVGFAVMFQAPHLIFFVVAYAAMVTVLVVAKMTTRF